jgi:hypothetical protein
MLPSSSVIVGQTIQKNEVGYNKLSLSIPKTPSYLNIPERLSNATEATDFVRQVANLSVEDREKAIVNEIVSGMCWLIAGSVHRTTCGSSTKKEVLHPHGRPHST